MHGRRRNPWYERHVFALSLVGIMIAVVRFAMFPSVDWGDALRAYPSPERHEGVRRLSATTVLAIGESRIPSGDFDGDGVGDELDREYFHMEPLFRPSTSGMLYVRSGSTGEVLLAHAMPTPFNSIVWCGDVDGNSTDDVAIQDKDGIAVYGRDPRPR